MKTFGKITLVLLSIAFLAILGCKKSDPRDAFVGTYNAEDKFVLLGTPFTETYSFNISKSSAASDRILLNGFGNDASVSLDAIVSNKNFTIPQQTIVRDGESVSVTGSGSLDGNRLTYSYSLALGGVSVTINVNGTANKR